MSLGNEREPQTAGEKADHRACILFISRQHHGPSRVRTQCPASDRRFQPCRVVELLGLRETGNIFLDGDNQPYQEGHHSGAAWEIMRMSPVMIKRLHGSMCNTIDTAWLATTRILTMTGTFNWMTS
ncbi:hypothetical protein CLAIMM_10519, partial [Cladophialophora immunda]